MVLLGEGREDSDASCYGSERGREREDQTSSESCEAGERLELRERTGQAETDYFVAKRLESEELGRDRRDEGTTVVCLVFEAEIVSVRGVR